MLSYIVVQHIATESYLVYCTLSAQNEACLGQPISRTRLHSSWNFHANASLTAHLQCMFWSTLHILQLGLQPHLRYLPTFPGGRSVCMGSKHRVCNQLTSSWRPSIIVMPEMLTLINVSSVGFSKILENLDEKFYKHLLQFYKWCVLTSYTNMIIPYFEILGATLAMVEVSHCIAYPYPTHQVYFSTIQNQFSCS